MPLFDHRRTITLRALVGIRHHMRNVEEDRRLAGSTEILHDCGNALRIVVPDEGQVEGGGAVETDDWDRIGQSLQGRAARAGAERGDNRARDLEGHQRANRLLLKFRSRMRRQLYRPETLGPQFQFDQETT